MGLKTLTRYDVDAYALLKAQEKRITKELKAWALYFKTALAPTEGMNGFAFRVELSEEGEESQQVNYREALVKLRGEKYVAALEQKAAEAPKTASAAKLLVRVNPHATKNELQYSAAIKARLATAFTDKAEKESLFKIARGE